MFRFLSRMLRSSRKNQNSSKPKVAARRKFFMPRFEDLEDRLAPATFTSVLSGLWDDYHTWGTAPGSIPGNNDTVDIVGGFTVTAAGTDSALAVNIGTLAGLPNNNLTVSGSLTVGAGGVTVGDTAVNGPATLLVNASGALNAGSITVNAPLNASTTNQLNVKGSVAVSGDVTLISSNTVPTPSTATALITFLNGQMNIGNNLTFTNGNASTTSLKIDMSGGAGTLGVGGTWNISATNGTFLAGTAGSTFAYTGSAGQALATTSINYDNLTLSGGVKSFPAVTIGIAASFTDNGLATNLSATNNTISFNGTIAQNIPALSYNNLTIPVSASSPKTFSGTSTIRIKGTFSDPNNLANFTANSTTVDYNNTGAQNITASNYFNLSLSGTGTKTFGAATTGIAGNLTKSGTANPSFNATSTINFNGTGPQTIPGFNYGNLTISGARGSANVTLDSLNPIGIAGTGATAFNPSATFTTGNYITTGNTINYNAGGAQTIAAFDSLNTVGVRVGYNDLVLSGSGTKTFAGGTSDIAGTLSTGGTATVDALANFPNINFNGTTTSQQVNGLSYYNLTLSGSGSKVFAGGITYISNTLTMGGTASADTTTNSSTIDYYAAGNQAVAAINYYNLILDTSGSKTFAAGTTGIAGTLTLNGSAGADFTTNSATINFNGTGAQTVNALNYYNLAVSGSRGTNNVTLAPVGTIGIAGTFTPSATFTSGNYVNTNSTISYNATGAQVVNAFNNTNGNTTSTVGYYNLTLAGNGTKTFASGTTRIDGSLTLSGFAAADAVSNSTTIEYDGTSAQTVPALNYYNLTIGGGNHGLTNVTLAAGTIGIAGTFNYTNAGFPLPGDYLNQIDAVTNSTTIIYNGTSQNVVSLNYYNLTLSGSGTKTFGVSPGDTIGIAGAFSPGSITANVTTNTVTINYNGPGAQTVAAFNYYNLSLSGSGTKTFAAPNATYTFTGLANVLTVSGSAVADFITNSSTINFNGSGGQDIDPLNYYNLVISGDRALNTISLAIAGGTVGIAGTFSPTYTNATTNINSATIVNYNASGNQTVAAYAYPSLTLSGSGTKTFAAGTVAYPTTQIAGALTLTGSASADATTNTTTIDYNGTAAQTVAAMNYYNLKISGARTNNQITLASTGTIGIAGNFDVSTVTFTTGSFANNNNTVTTGSTVNYNGTGAQTIVALNTPGYNNLTLSASGLKTFAGTTTINGNLVVSGTATVDATTNTTTITYGGGSQNVGAINYYYLVLQGTGTKTFAGGTTGLAGPDGGTQATALTFGGTAVADFTTNSSTVNFNGTGAQTVNALNYNNLTISGARTTNNVTLALLTNVTFGNNGTNDTITRSTGSWIADGFIDGQQITVSGAGNNNGTYTILTGGVSSSTLILTTNLTVTPEGPEPKRIGGGGTVGIAGTFSPTATFTGSGKIDPTTNGTSINYNATGSQTVAAFNYNNITLSGGGTKTFAAGTAGIAGTLTDNGLASFPTGSTVNFNGAGAQTVNALNYYNLTIGGSRTGSPLVTLPAGTIGIAGTGATAFSPANDGSFAYLVNAGNIINYNAAAGQTVAVFNTTFGIGSTGGYANLVLSGSGTKTFAAGATTIAGSATLAGTATGDAAANSTTVQYLITDNQSVAAINYYNLTTTYTSGTDTVTLAPGTIGIAGSFSSDNNVNITYVTTGNTLNYNAAGAQTVATFNYNNLTLSGSGTKTLGTTTGDSIGIAGSFTLGGSVTAASVDAISKQTVVNYNGTGAQTVAAINYYDLDIDGNHGATSVTLASGTIGILNDFDPSSAVFTTGGIINTGNTFNYYGAAQFVAPFNYNNLTLSGSGLKTFEAPTVAYPSTGIAGGLTIGNGVTVDATSQSSIINYNAAGAQTVTAMPYYSLTLSGSGTKTFAAGSVTYPTTQIAGALTITGTASANATTNTTTIDYNGTGAQTVAAMNYNNLTVSNNKGGNNVTLAATGTIGVAGAFNSTFTGGGTYLSTGSTVNYNGTGAQTIVALPYNNLTLSGSGLKTFAGSTTITGNLVVSGGATVDATTNSTTITYNSSSAQNVGQFGYYNLTLAGSGTKSFAAGTTSLAGSLTFNGGAGPATVDAVTNQSTINYNASTPSSPQVIVPLNYYNLSISGIYSGTTNVPDLSTGTIGVAGTFSPTAAFSGGGTYKTAGGTISYNGTGSQNITLFSYGTLDLSGTSTKTLPGGTTNISGGLTLSNGATSSSVNAVTNASTINYNGTGAQNIGVINYYNLTLSSGTAAVFQAGTTGIAGTLTLSVAIPDATTNSSTINFNGTGAQTVPAIPYYNLTISGAHGTSSVTLASGTIGVAGVFNPAATFTTGGYVVTGSTIDYNAAGAQTVVNFNYNSLSLSTSGTKTFAAGTTGIAGNLVLTGATADLTSNVTTVNFNRNDGTMQSVPALTYYNLTFSGSGVKQFAGSTSIFGNMVISGSATGDATTNATTITYNGPATQTVGAMPYDNLTLSGTGTKTFAAGTTSIAATLAFAGSITAGNVDAVTNAPIIVYNGSAQTVRAMNYYSLTLSGGAFTKTLEAGTTGIAGALTVNAGPTFDVTTNSTTVNYNGTGTQTVLALDYYNLTISGSHGGNTVTLAGTGTIKIAGTFNPTATNVLYSNTGSNIDFNADGPQTIPAFNYYQLSLDSTLSTTKTFAAGTTSIGDSLVINSNVTADVSSFNTTINYSAGGAQTIATTGLSNNRFNNLMLSGSGIKKFQGDTSIAGTLTVSGSASADTTTNSTTITYNGIGAQTVAAINYNNLTISGDRAGSTVTLAPGSFGIAGAFNPTATNVVWATSGTTFNYNSGTAQNVTAFSYNNLTLSGNGNKTLVGTISIAVAMDVSGLTGSTLPSTSTVIYNGTSAQTVAAINYNHLTLSGSGTKTFAAGTGSTGIAGTLTDNGLAAFASGNTVNFNGTGAQTINALNYQSLTISGARTSNSVTLASSGTIGVTGTFSPTATFAGGSYVVTGSTINYNAGAGQTVAAFAYNNLTLSGSGTKTFAAGTTTIAGNAAITSPATGDAATNGTTVNYGGTGAQTVAPINYYDLILSGSGTKTFTAGTTGIAHTLTDGGLASFPAGTVDFNGTGAQTINALNYNNLTISGARTSSTVTLASSGTIGVAGTFNPSATFTSGGYANTGSTISYNGSGSQTIASFDIVNGSANHVGWYFNLDLAGTGTKTFAAGTTGIANALTIGGTVTVNATTNATTIDYNGTAAQTVMPMNYNNLTVSGNKGGGNVILSVASPIGIAGVFSSTFTGGGTYVTTGSMVNYNGTVAQTVAAINYNNLTLSGSGTKTFAAGTTGIAGTLADNGLASFPAGAVDFNGMGAQTINALNYNNLTISGTRTSNTVTLASSGTIGVAGVFNPSATFTTGGYANTGSTINYNAGTGQAVAAFAYNNLTLSGGGTKTFATGTTTIAGNATITSPATGDAATNTTTVNYNGISAQNVAPINYYDLTLSGSGTKTFTAGNTGIAHTLTDGGLAGFATNSTVDFNGTGAQTINALNYNNLTISGARTSNTVTLASSGTIGIGGTFNPSATFTTGGYAITGSTINYNASASQTVVAFNYNDLVLSGTGSPNIKTLIGSIGIAGSLTFGSGTTATASASTGSTVTYNGTTQTVADINYYHLTFTGGTKTFATATNVGIAGTLTDNGQASFVSGSTVNFNGSGAQSINALDYYNLTITGSRTGSPPVTLPVGTIGILGSFSPASDGTLTYQISGSTIDYKNGSQNVTPFNYNTLKLSGSGTKTFIGTTGIAGNLDISGLTGTINTGTSTIVYNGSIAQNVAALNYYNLSLAGSNTKTFPASTVGIAGTLTDNGLASFPAGTVDFNGTGVQTINALNYNNLTISGNRTESPTVTLPAGTIGIGNSFSPASDGTFTYQDNGSIINYNAGAGQTVAAFSYKNLTLSGSGTKTFAAGTTTIAGNATVTSPAIGAALAGSMVNYNGSGSQTVAVLNYFNLNLSGSGTKTFAAGSIGIANALTIDSSVSANATTNATTIDYNGIAAQIVAPMNYNNLTVSGNKAGNNVTLSPAGPIGIAGVFGSTFTGGGTYITTGSTVNFNGSGAQTINALNYFNLTISGSRSGSPMVTLPAGTIGIGGAFSPSRDGTFTYQDNGSIIDYNALGGQTVAAFTYNNLTLSGSGSKTFAVGTTTIGGNATITSPATGDAAANSTTVNYNSVASQAVAAINYFNLILSGGGTKTFAAGTTGIANTLVDNSLAAFAASSTVDFNGSGAQTINALNYFNLNISGTRTSNTVTLAASGTIGVAGSFSPTASFTTGGISNIGSTIDYNASGPQTIANFDIVNGASSHVGWYYNLTLSGSGIKAFASGTIGIAAALTVGGTASIDTATTPNIIYNGTGSQTILALNYNNLALSGGGTKTFAGDTHIAGNLDVSGLSGTTATGTTTITYNGTGSQAVGALNYYNLAVSGDRAGNTVTLASSGTIGIAGAFNLSATSVTYAISGSTFNYNASASQTVAGFNYNNLVLSGSGVTNTKTFAGATGIAGSLTFSGTASADATTNLTTISYNGTGAQNVAAMSYQNLTLLNGAAGSKSFPAASVGIAGTLVDNGLASFPTNSTVDFNGSGAQSINALNYYNLTISGGRTGSPTVTLPAGTIGIGGTFSPASAGTFTYQDNGSTINYNAGTGQTVAAFTYNNLTLSGSGIKTFAAGTASIAGNATLTGSASGDAAANSTTLQYNGTGTQTVAVLNYYNLILSGGFKTFPAGSIGIAGALTDNGWASISSGNTINFNGSGAQTINALNYYNLVISGDRLGNTVTLASSGTIGIGSAFNPTATNVAYANSGSTINYNGIAPQTITTFNYNNLLLSGSGSMTFAAGTTGIAGTLTNTGSTPNTTTNNSTISYNGAGQTVAALNYYHLNLAGSGTKTFAGNTGITGNLTVSGGSADTTTFNTTITYNGTGSQTVGNIDYHNLTIDGSGTKTLAGAINVAGTLDIVVGTLNVNGATISGNVSLDGGVLMGVGTVETITSSTGGSLNPGNNLGILTSDTATFNAALNFNVEIGGTTAGTGYDQFQVTAAVSLGNAVLNVSLVSRFTPLVNQSFTIVNNAGTNAVTGIFNGLPEGTVFSSGGQIYSITYKGGTGNDVVLTALNGSAALVPVSLLNQASNTVTLNAVGTTQFSITVNGQPSGLGNLSLSLVPQVIVPASLVGNTTVTMNIIKSLYFAGGTGGGSDTLIVKGPAKANTYKLYSSSLVVNGLTMSMGNVENLQVIGNTNVDTFNVLEATATTVNFDGGAGLDKVVGGPSANIWNITGTNAGNLNSNLTFANVENLTGGSASDSFIFSTTGKVAGTVDGGAGANTLNYSTYNAAVSVNRISGVATGLKNFTNIQNVLGSSLVTSNTLYGVNLVSTWTISGANSGYVVDSKGVTFTFANMNNVIGGSYNDTFQIVQDTVSGTWAGTIKGGAGINTLKIHETGSTNPNHNWLINGSNTGILDTTTQVFSGIQNLVGGTGADVFYFTGSTGLTGTINGGLGSGTNSLRYSGTGASTFVGMVNNVLPFNNAVTINLQTSKATGTTGFQNMTDFVGRGTTGLDTFIGKSLVNSWTLTAQNTGNLLSGSLTYSFMNFGNLTGGTNTDTFNASGAQWSGTLSGGGGLDTLKGPSNATFVGTTTGTMLIGTDSFKYVGIATRTHA